MEGLGWLETRPEASPFRVTDQLSSVGMALSVVACFRMELVYLLMLLIVFVREGLFRSGSIEMVAGMDLIKSLRGVTNALQLPLLLILLLMVNIVRATDTGVDNFMLLAC